MPFKDPNDLREYQRWYYRRKAIEHFESQGLRPLDPKDPQSYVECTVCGRQSGRHANKSHRHYEGCFYADDVSDENSS